MEQSSVRGGLIRLRTILLPRFSFLIPRKTRPPRTKIPQQHRIHRDIHQILRRQRPIAEAHRRHRHTHEARRERRRHTALRNLLDLHLLRKIRRLRHTEAGEHEPQEHISAQRNQFRLVVVVRNQRGCEPQHHIEHHASHDVKPEHGVIVLVLRLSQIDEARLETTRLQFIGNHGEHRQHRRHTVVRRIQQSSQDDAKGQSQQLLHAIVHPAPEEPFRRFLL